MRKILTVFSFICLTIMFLSLPIMGACTAPKAAPTPAATPAPAPASPKFPSNIAMPTTATSSATYPMSVGVASVITKFTPMRCTAEPYDSTAVMLRRLKEGQAQLLGPLSAVTGWTIYHGTYEYKEIGKTNMRCVTAGADLNVVGLPIKINLDIKKVSQIKGLRVSLPKAVTNVQVLFEAMLAGSGLTRNDVQMIDVTSFTASAEAVKEGRADIIESAIGSAFLRDLDSVIPMRYLDCTATNKENEAKMFAYCPELHYYTVKAGELAATEDTVILGQDSYVFTLDTVSDDITYTVAKALYEHYDELASLHPDLKRSFKPEMAVRKSFSIPYHPGAIKFYKEVKLWTSDMDQAQAKALAEQ